MPAAISSSVQFRSLFSSGVAPSAAPGGEGGGLFAPAPSVFDAGQRARLQQQQQQQQQQPPSQPLFPGGAGGVSLFSGGAPGGPSLARPAHSAFTSLGAFSASASMSSQFADLDISEMQRAGYDSFSGAAGGPALGTFIDRDLASQLFGGEGGAGGGAAGQGPMPGGGLGGLRAAHMRAAQAAQAAAAAQQASDPAAALLSKDLMGEIEGLDSASSQQRGGDPMLSLPPDSAALFSPPTVPIAGLPGALLSVRAAPCVCGVCAPDSSWCMW